VNEPLVYTYFDYRAFLRDRQVWLKSRHAYFTLEHVAEKLGFQSKGHVSLIFNGKRNIAAKRLEDFAEVFQLEGRAKEFFLHLVQYQQADSFLTKKEHLDRMVTLMRIQDRRLVPAQYRLCEKWYTPVIRELLRGLDISDEWELLARQLRPAITGTEAREAVQVLSEIGLIKRNPAGNWKPTDKVVTFGEGWRDPAVRNFQLHALEGAREALIGFESAERDISTVVVSMSEDSFARVREVVRFARQEILHLAKTDKGAERVYQLSFAVYPVTETAPEGS